MTATFYPLSFRKYNKIIKLNKKCKILFIYKSFFSKKNQTNILRKVALFYLLTYILY